MAHPLHPTTQDRSDEYKHEAVLQKKFCMTCMHRRQPYATAMCAAPQLGVDMVLGNPMMIACQVVRQSDFKCGFAGIWYVYRPHSAATKEGGT